MLSNPRHEAFAIAVATGGTAADAYRRAFRYAGKNADSLGCRLMSGKVSNQINGRIKEIQREAERETLLTIEEKRRLYARVVRCSVHNLPLDSDLIQSVKKVKRMVKGETEEVIEIRILDKLRASELDSKLAGDVVEKFEHSGSTATPETVFLGLPKCIAHARPLKRDSPPAR